MGSGVFTTIARSTAQHFAGAASLTAAINATAPTSYILEVSPPTPGIPPGAAVTFHVFVPSGTGITLVQPYVLESDSFRFTTTTTPAADLTREGWTAIIVQVPIDATPILRLGVKLTSMGNWTDAIYLDSIGW